MQIITIANKKGMLCRMISILNTTCLLLSEQLMQ